MLILPDHKQGFVMGMNLESYLKKNNVWFKFIQKPRTIHTADAAKVTGIDLERITKNLICKTSEGEYAILIIPGNKKVNLKKAAEILKTQNICLVPFDKVGEISGYPPGGTPSVGHKTRMRAIIDKSILVYETVYCGGGTQDKILELRTEDVLELNDATIGEIVHRL